MSELHVKIRCEIAAFTIDDYYITSIHRSPNEVITKFQKILEKDFKIDWC